MSERHVDPEIILGFLKVRDDLLFWLSEQDGPPNEQVAPLWKAFELLNSGLEDVMQATGFVEDLTAGEPDKT